MRDNDNKKFGGDKHKYMKMCRTLFNNPSKVRINNQVDNRLSRNMNNPDSMSETEISEAKDRGVEVRGGYVI